MANNMISTTTGATLCVFNDASIGDTFCSFAPEGKEGKIKLYNAINNPDHRIADCINKEIAVRDVVIKAVKLTEERNKKPGAGQQWVDEEGDRDGFRVVLLDMNGESYTATSSGIYNSVATLRAVFGELHFDEGLTVEVNQVKTKNGNTLTLKVTG